MIQLRRCSHPTPSTASQKALSLSCVQQKVQRASCPGCAPPGEDLCSPRSSRLVLHRGDGDHRMPPPHATSLCWRAHGCMILHLLMHWLHKGADGRVPCTITTISWVANSRIQHTHPVSPAVTWSHARILLPCPELLLMHAARMQTVLYVRCASMRGAKLHTQTAFSSRQIAPANACVITSHHVPTPPMWAADPPPAPHAALMIPHICCKSKCKGVLVPHMH